MESIMSYFLYYNGKLTAMSRKLDRLIDIITKNGWSESSYEVLDINGEKINV